MPTVRPLRFELGVNNENYFTPFVSYFTTFKPIHAHIPICIASDVIKMKLVKLMGSLNYSINVALLLKAEVE